MSVITGGHKAVGGRHAWGHPLLLACGLCFLLLPAPAWPEVYTWADERGVQHFVGDAADIPDRVRDRARLFLVSPPPATGETAPPPPAAPLALREGNPVPPAPMDQGAFAVSLAGEALAAEGGVALVPIEPPQPSRPATVEVPAQVVLLESVVVPAFRSRHGRVLPHRHLRKRVLTDRGERRPHRRPATVSREQPAEETSGQFHRLGEGFQRLGDGFHRIGTGFHRLESPQSPPRRGHR